MSLNEPILFPWTTAINPGEGATLSTFTDGTGRLIWSTRDEAERSVKRCAEIRPELLKTVPAERLPIQIAVPLPIVGRA